MSKTSRVKEYQSYRKIKEIDESDYKAIAEEIKSQLQKGNFEYAAKLAKINFELNLNPLNELVESLVNSLDVSLEINKYQAILQLINNAGIEIPMESQYLLTSHKDSHKASEFYFIYGLLHKLSAHYLNLTKIDLLKTLEREGYEELGMLEKINHAFQSYDFNSLKSLCPNSKELSKIDDDFGAYFQVYGKAVYLLDNDIALEVLAINGLRKKIIAEEVTVFRGIGIHGYTSEDIDYLFKYGHISYATSQYSGGDQRSLAFYSHEHWNKGLDGKHEPGSYKYGGTYTSMDPTVGLYFSKGFGIFFEFQLPETYFPMMCNNEEFVVPEYEILANAINGENIVAIYQTNPEDKTLIVHKNPYIDQTITPRFKTGDTCTRRQEDLDLYDNVMCKNFIGEFDSTKWYSNYEDFMLRYSQEDFMQDQKIIYEDYFAERPLYIANENPYIDYFAEEVDLSQQCSLF